MVATARTPPPRKSTHRIRQVAPIGLRTLPHLMHDLLDQREFTFSQRRLDRISWFFTARPRAQHTYA